jgi:endonuclease/exonuclease/phosphatase family metal-dependent hydrolase
MKIRILSYNIHKGFNIGNNSFILQEIRHAIRDVNADILFLQEVIGDHEHIKHKIPDWKTAIQFEYLADTVWSHFAYGKNAIYAEGHHGNAILSKFPIVDWSNQDISTNQFEQRGYLKAKIQIPEKGLELILANTHLNLTQAGRNKQADLIIKDLKEVSETPWILVGDFNDWNKKIASKIWNHLHAQEAFHFLHGNFPKTFPSFFPTLSLDRFFFKGVKVVSAHTLDQGYWKKLSDHLPLLVEIEIE